MIIKTLENYRRFCIAMPSLVDDRDSSRIIHFRKISSPRIGGPYVFWRGIIFKNSRMLAIGIIAP